MLKDSSKLTKALRGPVGMRTPESGFNHWEYNNHFPEPLMYLLWACCHLWALTSLLEALSAAVGPSTGGFGPSCSVRSGGPMRPGVSSIGGTPRGGLVAA